MKCKDCDCCRIKSITRWSSDYGRYIKEQVYECIGVKEPFIIEDINAECTEYKDRIDKKTPDISIEEVIQYWEGLLKTFSSQLETENNYFGRMHLQYTVDVLNATIDALKTR